MFNLDKVQCPKWGDLVLPKTWRRGRTEDRGSSTFDTIVSLLCWVSLLSTGDRFSDFDTTYLSSMAGFSTFVDGTPGDETV